MTPAARIAAAIEILDVILSGSAAEQALTGWARRARFAGSKDRAAIRDLVFDGLRNLRSYAVLGGTQLETATGRAVMLGRLHAAEQDPAEVFTGQGHAPSTLQEQECQPGQPEPNDLWNLPDWLNSAFRESCGASAFDEARLLGQRAPVTLRVNAAKTTRDAVRTALQAEGILADTNQLSDLALTVTEGARQLTRTQCYLDGDFELQDAASQAVVEALPVSLGSKILDYCAGGGGKSLALAARGATVTAHDVSEARLEGIIPRAQRAGVSIARTADEATLARQSFDVVLVDAPCTGSGSWRRAPHEKWRLTPERLEELTQMQEAILAKASTFVREKGFLAYVTCSVLKPENEVQAERFDHEPGWTAVLQKRWPISEHGDGFFLALWQRD